MELPKNIKDEIWEYCRINDITSIDDFIIKMVKQGFTSEKYGAVPWEKEPEVKEVEIIKEVEKIIEKVVPVEIIKEVEKIVEKEVFISDDEANMELKKLISKLEDEVTQLKNDYEVLNSEKTDFEVKFKEYRDSNAKLEKENESLLRQIEELNKKIDNEGLDIYKENKKGFLGSNISDLWKKKTD